MGVLDAHRRGLDARDPSLQSFPRTCLAWEDTHQGLLRAVADRIISEKAGMSWMLNLTVL